MGKVEAQTIICHHRSLLRHMIAKDLAQRFMQQMGGRMIGADRSAAININLQFERKAKGEAPFNHIDLMHDELAEFFLCVFDAHDKACSAHLARITDLAARFSVERRLVENHQTTLALLEALRLLSLMHQRCDNAFGALRIIT